MAWWLGALAAVLEEFNSKYPHGGLEPSVAPVLGISCQRWLPWTPDKRTVNRHTFC